MGWSGMLSDGSDSSIAGMATDQPLGIGREPLHGGGDVQERDELEGGENPGQGVESLPTERLELDRRWEGGDGEAGVAME